GGSPPDEYGPETGRGRQTRGGDARPSPQKQKLQYETDQEHRKMKDDKRLKRKVRNSYIVSTVSISLVLFLLGSVGYLMTAAMKMARTLQESVSVTVELRNGLSDEQRERLTAQLTAEPLVGTIAYSPKEEK